jgi:hypothetical protein
MKTQESFSGWNFSSIWAINPNINDGYPYLINNHDITPPEYLKAETIARNKILVYFNEDLNGSALNINDFKVDVSGNEYTISSLSET